MISQLKILIPDSEDFDTQLESSQLDIDELIDFASIKGRFPTKDEEEFIMKLNVQSLLEFQKRGESASKAGEAFSKLAEALKKLKPQKQFVHKSKYHN